jgi:hypothetical protein
MELRPRRFGSSEELTSGETAPQCRPKRQPPMCSHRAPPTGRSARGGSRPCTWTCCAAPTPRGRGAPQLRGPCGCRLFCGSAYSPPPTLEGAMDLNTVVGRQAASQPGRQPCSRAAGSRAGRRACVRACRQSGRQASRQAMNLQRSSKPEAARKRGCPHRRLGCASVRALLAHSSAIATSSAARSALTENAL